MQDGTKDPAREVQGRVTVIVRDEPDAPAAPHDRGPGDRSSTIRWAAPRERTTRRSAATRSTSTARQRGRSARMRGRHRADASRASPTARPTPSPSRAQNGIGEVVGRAAPRSRTPYGTPSEPLECDRLGGRLRARRAVDIELERAEQHRRRRSTPDAHRLAVALEGVGGRSTCVLERGRRHRTRRRRARGQHGQRRGAERRVATRSASSEPAAARPRRVSICKGGPQGGRQRGAGALRERPHAAGHDVHLARRGLDGAFYRETFNIGGNGKQTLQNWLGVRSDAQIWVVIEGPTSISRTNIIAAPSGTTCGRTCTG